MASSSPLNCRSSERAVSISVGSAAAPRRGPLASWPLVLNVWRLGGLYFHGADSKRKARFLLLVVLLLCAVSAGMLVQFSYVLKDLSTALSNKDVDGFYHAILKFACVVAVAAPLLAYYDYMQDLLVIEWRIWLTDTILTDYFANRSYFDLKMEGKLDNPDQRICEDVASFVRNAVDIITLTTSKVLNICAFTGVLWSIASELVYFLLLYSCAGTFLTVKVFGNRIMSLKFQALQKEADFRYSLVRIRDNAESIAFYRGEKHESNSINGFFSSLILNAREIIIWSRHLSLFSHTYEFAVQILPSLLIAPRYFAGQVEFGVVSQAGFAFRRALTSLSVITLKFENFSGLAAQTERLNGLLLALENHNSDWKVLDPTQICSFGKSGLEMDVLEECSLSPLLNLEPTGYISREEWPGLVIKGLFVTTPNLRTLLIKDLTLSLTPGESMLVMGPSGCGKSSFLRVLAGLWNCGKGLIQGPSTSDSFFLPQKPYMPLGNLREQLLFPSSNNQTDHSDDSLLRSFEEVSLDDLPIRVGGLDVVCDWGDVLSSGEQQRIAFARLLLHQPKMAFLDEATSSLDATNESRLYSLLEQRISSFVSVGHRTSLVKFHTYILQFGENNIWKLFPRREFEKLHSS